MEFEDTVSQEPITLIIITVVVVCLGIAAKRFISGSGPMCIDMGSVQVGGHGNVIQDQSQE